MAFIRGKGAFQAARDDYEIRRERQRQSGHTISRKSIRDPEYSLRTVCCVINFLSEEQSASYGNYHGERTKEARACYFHPDDFDRLDFPEKRGEHNHRPGYAVLHLFLISG